MDQQLRSDLMYFALILCMAILGAAITICVALDSNTEKIIKALEKNKTEKIDENKKE